MTSRLPDWCMRHRLGTALLAAGVALGGLFAVGQLPLALLPHVPDPCLEVQARDPGTPTRIMEAEVTRPLEAHLAGVGRVIGMDSVTTDGRTLVRLRFASVRDRDAARAQVEARLDDARRYLPGSIEPPITVRVAPAHGPVATLMLTSATRPIAQLQAYAGQDFASQFVNLPGVAAVTARGGVRREIDVVPDPARLAALGLSLGDLVQAIEQGGDELPAGTSPVSRQGYDIRRAQVTNLDALGALPVPLPGGDNVTVSDVARIVDTYEDERLRVLYDGRPAVEVTVTRQPGASTLAVADQVTSHLAWLQANGLIPADVQVHTLADRAQTIARAIAHVTLLAVAGLMLATLVALGLTGDGRLAAILALAVALAVVASFLGMALFGVRLNVLTVGALALGVGLLADGAVFMSDALARPADADAATAALATAAAARLAALAPVFLAGGVPGALFGRLAIAAALMAVAMLVACLTLVPALAARRRAPGGRWRRATEGLRARLQERYASGLARVRRRPARSLALAAAVLGAGLAYPVCTRNTQGLPPVDTGQIRIHVTADPEITLDAMQQVVQGIDGLIRAQPDVRSIDAHVGGVRFGPSEDTRPSRSSISVQLLPSAHGRVSVARWLAGFYATLARHPVAGVRVNAEPAVAAVLRGRGLAGEALVRVQGPDLAQLHRIGDAIVWRLRSVAGLRAVHHSLAEAEQQVGVQVDPDRADLLDVRPAAVRQALRIALKGVVVGELVAGDHRYAIRVRLPPAQAQGARDLGGLLIKGDRGEQPGVYLRDVAQVQSAPGPAQIQRQDGQRIVTVSGDLVGSRSRGEVLAQVRAALRGLPLPPGYRLELPRGWATLTGDAPGTWALIGLALALVCAVALARYRSWREPLVVALGALLSLGAALLVPALTGMPVSPPVWLGLMLLTGMGALPTLRALDALARGAAPRLRPTLTAALAAAAALAPVALRPAGGAEMLQPLALILIGGILGSVPVNLMAVPAAYALLRRAPRPAEAG